MALLDRVLHWELYFHFLSHWMGDDRGDSFPSDFEPDGIPFGSKSKEKLSPRSCSIQCGRKWKHDFLSVQESEHNTAISIHSTLPMWSLFKSYLCVNGLLSFECSLVQIFANVLCGVSVVWISYNKWLPQPSFEFGCIYARMSNFTVYTTLYIACTSNVYHV